MKALTSDHIVSGLGEISTRGINSKIYISYILLAPSQKIKRDFIKLKLPTGEYTAYWYSPSNGAKDSLSRIVSNGEVLKILHPVIQEDIVLTIIKKDIFAENNKNTVF
jgi:hypothetical protein